MGSIEDVLLECPLKVMIPGSTFYSGKKEGLAFIVKDLESNVKKTKSNSPVQIRSSIYNTENGALGVIIIKIDGALYACFLDFCNPVERAAVKNLCFQEKVIIEFRRDIDLKICKQMMMNNEFKSFAKDYKDFCLSKKVWDPSVVTKLRKQLTYKYDIEKLWMALKE